MRLSTITNWAYGATVALTLVSGTTMLLASDAQREERAAVAQRHGLDQATANLERDIFALTDHARQYLNTGDETYLVLYRGDIGALASIEDRIRHVRDAGASVQELTLLKDAMRWADTLHDEQQAALAAHQRGDEAGARRILFGGEYERELDRAVTLVERFQDQLDQRTDAEVVEAGRVAQLWRTTSEIVLGLTGLLFLAVLYFIFKRRVLRPVVRLSDVVNRLAAQDFAVEPPAYGEIDEIGDMAQAIRIFRENGLERQRLEEERAADRAVRDLLSRMTQRMQGCDTLLDLKEVVQRFVPEIAPEFAGRLYLVDPARNAVVEACDWLNPVHSSPEFSPLSCWAMRRGLAHRPAGEAIDVPCDHLDRGDGPVLDTLCLPLTAHRKTLGLLYFELRAASGRGTPDVYLSMLAENVSLALANLRLRDTLREMAMADPLTGLANRRQLDGMMEALLADAERLGQPISCLMVDIDHFKRFNDAFGHEAGDTVLREVGAVLRHATREEGHAFRYGGEEFLLVMPGFDAERAAERAEDIRQRIAALDVTHHGGDLGPVTASLGVATAPIQCTMDRLIQSADAAVYRAKALGRDRVISATARKIVA
ncbi:diguanylate cyclase [Novosphingobium sp. JCM 18896]|uniref:diguanylate cyclase n=1 Tax=Novosphingobium sp. JCM 18896 TaxID=2989731 RepID=UPI002223DF7D|nr:diguanylate cyclase [Novosphingobium sp. JCM 18896]MCW1430762.1 diguanylate cyclase [Novosphingobium sp. JCM 18896]